ncbi:MAG: HupE/UreJ family protein, partial [Myxococcota bacterium]
RCRPEGGPVRRVERDGRLHLSLRVAYACPAPVEGLVLHDDTVFDDDPRHEAIVRIRGPGRSDAVVLRPGSRSAALGEAPTTAGLVGVFLWEGMLHLATGYDHVLFLLSLLLAAGFVVVRRGIGPALRDVAILVTAFTLGHSVTLIAAALEVVVLPSRPVEAIIAASIVAVAGHNVVRPEERRSLPWMAFVFGLIHGFGFSSVLAELGLPAGQTVLALVAFNVGIEVAQLVFVAIALGPIAWAAQLPSYRSVVVRGGSVAIGAVATVWLVERVVG